MKVDEFSDDVIQTQMYEFADSVRRAVAAEFSVIIVSKAVSDKPGTAVSGAMAFDTQQQTNSRAQQVQATLALLKTAASMLDRLSGGVIKVHLETPDGDLPIGTGDIHKFVIDGGG